MKKLKALNPKILNFPMLSHVSRGLRGRENTSENQKTYSRCTPAPSPTLSPTQSSLGDGFGWLAEFSLALVGAH